MSTLRAFSLMSFLLASLLLPVSASAGAVDCPVNSDWLTNPSLPTEVKKSGSDGTSNFCDFYQFSTQTFLYLMSPDGTNGRNFQMQSNFPLLEFDDDGNPGNSCDMSIKGATLRTSLTKSIGTGQAGGGATIYDQNGNVVYYDVRFNRSLCDLTASAVEMQKQNIINFPGGTMELKFAWKVLSQAEIAANTFVTQDQLISGKIVTLGLVGMHVVRATEDHPEFVWASYEHNANSPDCHPSKGHSYPSWTFASAKCAKALPGSAAKGDACKFNQPESNLTDPTGTPTNICRVYPYGTASGDLKAEENIADIMQQNAQVLELLTRSSTAPSMKVLANYFNLGALWLSNRYQSSGGVGVPNERGSLRLANPVAETDYQHVNLAESFISNCFGCHNYSGSANNITSQALSHTFRNIKVGLGQAIDITASSTIGNGVAAKAICGGAKGACTDTASYLTWNGQWTNINTSAGSVCGCKMVQ